MNFAICDGDQKAREKLISMIEDYAAERKIGIDYRYFDSCAELEKQLQDYDVFFLEHCMPKMNGLDLAHKIREVTGNKKVIVFVATDEGAVFDAFAVNAHRYLVKPVKREKIFEALDAYFLRNGVDGCLMIKSGGRVNAVKLSDIMFIEIIRKDLYIHCKKEVYVCRRTINSVEEELAGKRFFRVHRSYLVNMNNIKNYDNQQIEFFNGQKINISMRKYTEFSKAMNGN